MLSAIKRRWNCQNRAQVNGRSILILHIRSIHSSSTSYTQNTASTRSTWRRGCTGSFVLKPRLSTDSSILRTVCGYLCASSLSCTLYNTRIIYVSNIHVCVVCAAYKQLFPQLPGAPTSCCKFVWLRLGGGQVVGDWSPVASRPTDYY